MERKPNIRSLSFKLTIAFLVVAILGAALVAVLMNWQTRQQFDTLVNQIYEEEIVDLRDRLTDYYQENGSWSGVTAALFLPRPAAPENAPPNARIPPVVLVDGERQVVYGNLQYETGELLSAEQVENGLPIDVEGETVGWIVLDLFGGDRFGRTPEANFLADLNRITIWSALAAGGIALLLGAWLARTISHPITELKTATEQVAKGRLGAQVAVQSADEIGQLATSFNRMSADLARSNELRQQMTADIAHDLRTPLSVIQGYTEGLDEGKLHGSSEIYQAMHKQVKHLTRLVEDLRTLSLADAGQLSLHPQSIASRDLLEHSVLLFAPQAERQEVALHLDLPDTLPRIHVDLDRMVQVLGNLISNALRHTPAGGHIWLSAERQAQQLFLRVQDTGAGIEPEDLPHIFERFYSGDKSRSARGESGLGLAIARSIVEAHNGRISAVSPPGQGTTFTIVLPVAEA